MNFRRPIGWVCIALGALVTVASALRLVEAVLLMDRFGLLSNWDSVWAFRWIFGHEVGNIVIGLGLLFAGGWLVTRKQRAALGSAPSHFD